METFEAICDLRELARKSDGTGKLLSLMRPRTLACNENDRYFVSNDKSNKRRTIPIEIYIVDKRNRDRITVPISRLTM